MCDFNRLSGFLISAQAIYLGMLVTLGIAIFNSGSFWLVALNIPLMIGLIAACGIATGLAAAALNEANICKNSQCGAAASDLSSWLTAFVANLGILTGLLIGASAAALIPGVGALVLAGVLGYAVALGIGLSPVIESGVAAAVGAFNTCQQQHNASSSTAAATTVTILTGLTYAAAAFVLGGAGLAGGWKSWAFSHA